MKIFLFQNLPQDIQSCILRDAVSTGKVKPEVLASVSRSFREQINNPNFTRAILRRFNAPFDPSETDERVLKKKAWKSLSLINIDRIKNIPHGTDLLALLDTRAPEESVPVLKLLTEFSSMIGDPEVVEQFNKILQKPFVLSTFQEKLQAIVESTKFKNNEIILEELAKQALSVNELIDSLSSISSDAERNKAIERWIAANLDALNKVIKLDLTCSDLSVLPSWIGNLRQLQFLELDNNQLSSLPESFGNLQALSFLRLDDNQLSSLPESLGNLQALKCLYLANNQLSSLPESFGNLRELEVLALTDNQLSSLPESFGNLQRLSKLRIDDNLRRLLPPALRELENPDN